ncbi:MAG TPA: nucleoid-associated protein [Bacteroidia bacterium]|jgi:hypothetical protein|nr:nucleoid-associated protein [Bacteroidia bacterium]
MINLKDTILTNCIIHKVGNKVKAESIKLSKNELSLNEDMERQLRDYFLKPFATPGDTFHFHHDIKLKMNEVYTCSDDIFEDEDFVKTSMDIANHLYQQTRHPAIKSGELFIALFDEIMIDNAICSGLGIFKSERKENFFKTTESDKGIGLVMDSGLSQQKLDKGCLILNDAAHEGFKVFSYEHNNADTEYWRNDFLGITLKHDTYFQTKEFLSICKDFVKERLPGEFEVTKADQIDLLNKSVDYFKNTKEFKTNDFANAVLGEPELIKSFKKYKGEYEKENDLDIDDSFSISNQAVKTQAKTFKSILKLDKNFHIYIHGNKNMIQHGVEKDGRKFYKIYYNEEK